MNRRNLKREHGVAFDVESMLQGVDDPPTRLARLLEDDDVAAAGARMLNDFVIKPKKTAGYYIPPEVLSDTKLKTLYDALLGVDAAKTTRIIPLPQNVLRAQMEAVKRRFGAPADAEKMVERATNVLCCPNCSRIKNFVLKQTEREGKKENNRASGWHKLVLDEDAGVLRCAKVEACREFRVKDYSVLSEKDGVLSGGVLVGRFGTAVISPCCGMLVETSALGVTADGYDCPACVQPTDNRAEGEPDPKLCAFCMRELRGQNAGLHMNLVSESKAVFRYSFCKSHFRKWAKTEEPCSFHFVSHNMSNRTGEGLVLPS